VDHPWKSSAIAGLFAGSAMWFLMVRSTTPAGLVMLPVCVVVYGLLSLWGIKRSQRGRKPAADDSPSLP